MIRGACKLLGADSITMRDLLGKGLGSSDKSWNMLALSPLVCDLWARGLFAFKYIGVFKEEPIATIQLQFCWMPQPTNPDPYRKIDFESSEELAQDITRYAETSSTPQETRGAVSLANNNTSRAILSRDILKIRMPYDEAVKMKTMLHLQWAMISLLTLSGAAGFPELLREPSHHDSGAFQTQNVLGDNKHVHGFLSPVRMSRYSYPDERLHPRSSPCLPKGSKRICPSSDSIKP